MLVQPGAHNFHGKIGEESPAGFTYRKVAQEADQRPGSMFISLTTLGLILMWS